MCKGEATSPRGHCHRCVLKASRYGLTPTQYEIAVLTAKEYSQAQIGIAIGIAHQTVNNHNRETRKRFEVQTNVGVAVKAVRLGIA